ncbi:MAG TPA: AAA family ATPase [Ktedonobacterales bacterium]
MTEHHLEFELPVSALRKTTDPTSLGFTTTEHLEAPPAMIGQDRAREAMELALGIPDSRFNLFVMGVPGSGRTATALAMTREAAQHRKPASDWVYTHNFEHAEEPLALELPVGRGRGFAHDIETYVMACRRELRRVFNSDAYRQRRTAALQPALSQRNQLLEALNAEARAEGFSLQGTPGGLAILPLRPGAAEQSGGAGTMTPEEFQALPPEEQQRIEENNAKVEAAASQIFPQVRTIEEGMRSLMRELDHEVAEAAVEEPSQALEKEYAGLPEVTRFLHSLRADIVAHAAILREAGVPPSDTPEEDESPTSTENDMPTPDPLDEDLREAPTVRALLRNYSINVMVGRRPDESAPVIEETNPTYTNLIGRIDIGARDGLPFTDHMMLRPGVMHKAAGGYLIIHAREMIASHSWEAVKRVARFGHIELENGSMTAGSAPGATIRPQPIRADLKIILIGDPLAYGALAEGDPDFRQIFAVRADFDVEMARDVAGEQAYAQIAGDAVRKLGFPPFSSAGVATVIDEGSRWVDDQAHISTELMDVGDLCREAGYFARRAGAPVTDASHVNTAIAARTRRESVYSDKTLDMILDGSIKISTTGAVVGQVNALSVQLVFGHPAGIPSRITARVSPGMAGVVTVERETEMSGPTHTKGVLVLSGYLAGRFAQRFPMSLSASLCFEQLYSPVDGDSASSAELYAILSALADVPISQEVAVTGSVNQRGEVQAIGGVTQKIEGFFHLCQARGLTGQQGVLMPAVNARNLMLRDDVIAAVSEGKFHIYGVSTIEEGIQILTGIPFGTLTSEGKYLAGTVAERVLTRLAYFHDRVRQTGFMGMSGSNS